VLAPSSIRRNNTPAASPATSAEGRSNAESGEELRAVAGLLATVETGTSVEASALMAQVEPGREDKKRLSFYN
jgi:hypothetical protein